MQIDISTEVEPQPGFDDAMVVWVALITECERLKQIIETRCIQEPMFGVPQRSKPLTDAEIAGVEKKRSRCVELAARAFDRRERIAAAFGETTP